LKIENFTEGWKPVHIGQEGEVLSIDGINPWLHTSNWHQIQDNYIIVSHPSYQQKYHRAWVYEVTVNRKTVRFAATELSNGVWGFYVSRHATV
jgi:hypothetical protein